MLSNKHVWLVVVALVLVARPAWAVTKDWNALSGDWSNGDNWTPVGVPAETDDANILFADDVARTVTLNTTATVQQLRVDMTGAGTNANTLSITGGELLTTNAYIGQNGRGTIEQSAGSYVAQGQGLRLGAESGSVGTYNLSGTGALTSRTSYIGYSGTGDFNHSGGSHSLVSDGSQLYLGFLPTGIGNYTLTGGSLSAVENEYIGYTGTGNFLHSGGTNNVALTLHVGAQPAGNGTYALSGNGQVSANQILVGDFGTGSFNQSGGSTVTSSLIVGHQVDALGTYTLSSGTLSAVSAVVGSLATGLESQVGGAFVQNGGSHYVDSLYVGLFGTGSYVLSSGALVTSLSASIGHEGTGTLSQNGGSHTANSITIGHLAGSSGVYNVNGGILNAASIYVGGSSNGAGGTGALSISGSSTSVTVPGTIKVHNTPGTSLNLNGGTLNVGAIDVGGVTSKFNWSGGTLHVMGDVAWSGGEPANSTGAIFGSQLQLASNRTLRVTGNESIGGNGQFTLNMGGGATHAVTGTITLAPGGTILTTTTSTLSYANFVQAGGTIQSFFRNTSNFTYQSGTINAQFVNAGTLSIASTMTVAGTMQNDGSVTVGAGQTLAVQGPLTNSGNFTLEGGTISASSTFTNAGGGTISGRGTLGTSSQFFNRGTISINGVLAYGSFSSFSNEGVIEGVGTLSNTNGQLSNSAGGVINATTSGGTLVINAFQNNNPGGVINVGPTSTLSIGTQWTNSGIVNLQGLSARLTGTSVNNMGTIQGSGTITSNMTQQSGTIRAMGGDLYLTAANISMSSTSQLHVLAGSSMTFLQGHAVNQGTISLTGGTFDNNGKTMNNQGTINGHGVFRAGGLTNSSSRLISIGGGDMEFFGNVTNQGVVNIQSGRSAYFFNNVSGSGAFTGGGTAVFLGSLSPGSSPASVSFGGNVALVGGTSLNIEIGGLAAGTGYDRIQVNGELSIGGILAVSLINGFSPSAGDTFDILDWGTLDGTFSDVLLPNLGATKAWDTSNLYSSGVLSVVSAGLPGDHNLDGAVDAADFVMWQKVSSGTPQGYADWVANFGATAGGGGAADRAGQLGVPEPAAAMTLVTGFLAMISSVARLGRRFNACRKHRPQA